MVNLLLLLAGSTAMRLMLEMVWRNMKFLMLLDLSTMLLLLVVVVAVVVVVVVVARRRLDG